MSEEKEKIILEQNNFQKTNEQQQLEKFDKNSLINIQKREKKQSFIKKSFIFIFGFLLPSIALITELTSRMCAGAFFDPLPTNYHALLISLVPITSILYLYFLSEKNNKAINLLNGITLSVSGFYSIIFLPIVPLGIIAILFMGIGFLPLAPLMSLIVSFIILKSLIKNYRNNIKYSILGIILGLFFIISLELPVTLTRYAMELSSSENKDTKLQGINLLRKYGNNDIMLRYCYGIRGKSPDLISFFIEQKSTMTLEKAQDIYYKATGKTYNSQEIPENLRERFQLTDDFVFDQNLAGENVGGKLKSLSLNNSRLDGIFDQKSGMAYTEWTMSFKNSASWEQEARMQIKLAPKSTVSRLTLWVNGVPQEAAFAGKEEVKRAYQSVVARKRDPVLVTSNGLDRVLVQCYPVPPNNKGEMKIKLGITSPMNFSSKKESNFVFPQIIERNFNLDKGFKHNIWYDSKNYISLQDSNLKTNFLNNIYTIKGEISNKDIEKFPYSIKINRKDEIKDSWVIDSTNSKYIIKQTIHEIKNKKIKKLSFIIDGSLETNKYLEEISNILKNIPESINTNILIASDEIISIDGRNNIEKSENLLNNKFIGGNDNSEALIKSLDNNDSEIIWLHGVQPEANYFGNSKVDNLFYTLKRLNKRINEIQFGIGSNVITSNLESYKYFNQIPITGNFSQSLGSFIKSLVLDTNRLEFKRNNVLKTNESNENQASMHLEKIWANERVLNLLDNNNMKDSIKTASKYHIVTPVSGAVVLENKQQYIDNNIKPVKNSEVPIIPEPEEWLLIIVVSLFIIYSVFNRKNVWKNA
ncbi:MAG: VIT domain-containing protein [Candidatus Sericytochromatia bacterium]